jgi:hypothetical protein
MRIQLGMRNGTISEEVERIGCLMYWSVLRRIVFNGLRKPQYLKSGWPNTLLEFKLAAQSISSGIYKKNKKPFQLYVRVSTGPVNFNQVLITVWYTQTSAITTVLENAHMSVKLNG